VKGTLAFTQGDCGNSVTIGDSVMVTVGPVTDTFTMVEKRGKWEYKGPGPITKMKIDWTKGKFEFKANDDFSGLTNPVTISLQVGSQYGAQTVMVAGLDPDPAPGPDPDPILIRIKKAEYKASKRELKVEALNNEAGGSHTMTLYDEVGDVIGTMTPKKGNKYEYKAKGVDDPGDTVTVESDTGKSATATVKHK